MAVRLGGALGLELDVSALWLLAGMLALLVILWGVGSDDELA